jgi:biotin synthase
VQNVKRAGLFTCSGGIIGMGENDEDIVELTYATRELAIDSIPVNFLYPIAGTPLGERRDFAPARGLKTLCLMRFLNPSSEIRMAAGRELYLGNWGGLALYPANSIFVEGYLTTPGQPALAARKLVEDAGFEVQE